MHNAIRPGERAPGRPPEEAVDPLPGGLERRAAAVEGGTQGVAGGRPGQDRLGLAARTGSNPSPDVPDEVPNLRHVARVRPYAWPIHMSWQATASQAAYSSSVQR